MFLACSAARKWLHKCNSIGFKLQKQDIIRCVSVGFWGYCPERHHEERDNSWVGHWRSRGGGNSSSPQPSSSSSSSFKTQSPQSYPTSARYDSESNSQSSFCQWSSPPPSASSPSASSTPSSLASAAWWGGWLGCQLYYQCFFLLLSSSRS